MATPDVTWPAIEARARELAGLSVEEWTTSLAVSDGRALDALNLATHLLANGLTDRRQAVPDVPKAEARTHALWRATEAQREAARVEAVGRVYGAE